ncbi:butyrophilin subfamily 1 member A1-like [Chiroxiphia lanceolata]|uniref:butyrophilin subfamily 1 member A1-like n=1 Tax=Chiroxiphia lanceolata TaxID=296741 RepID=UPI0013CE6053|nr:butyrophilin subfamily 1 member A1-like [Chiroxiphia lanceolata]
MDQRRWLPLALTLLPAWFLPLSYDFGLFNFPSYNFVSEERRKGEKNFELSSPQNVVGIVGQDTILPCTISSTKPLDNPEVQWKKITDGHPEDIYTYGQSGGEPMQKYHGRTSLPGDGFATGNVSLMLKNVQPADEGMYSCTVTSRDWSADRATELSIAGTGEVFLEILGPHGQGLELGCRSHGWFPEPTVQWVTEDGQGLFADTEIQQDSEKVFSVWSRVTVTGEEVGKVTCQILNPLVQMEKKTTARLSGAAFPRVSPFVPAFWTLLTLFLLTLAAGAVLVFRGKGSWFTGPHVFRRLWEVNPCEKVLCRTCSGRGCSLCMVEEGSEQMAQVKNESGGKYHRGPGIHVEEGHLHEVSQKIQTLQEDFQNMQQSTQCDIQLLRTDLENKLELFKIQYYKEKHRGYRAVVVTLDAATAHPGLGISTDGKRVKEGGFGMQDIIRDFSSNEKRFDSHLFVLAKQRFRYGRLYWEVSVQGRRNWALGIARESVTRKGPLTLTPKNGFWVIGLADGRDYWAYTDPQTRLSVSGELEVIGIFLDILAKEVSFYHVYDKEAALYTFSIADGSSQRDEFIPFFSLGSATANHDHRALVIV